MFHNVNLIQSNGLPLSIYSFLTNIETGRLHKMGRKEMQITGFSEFPLCQSFFIPPC